jgi:hypothetical protein
MSSLLLALEMQGQPFQLSELQEELQGRASKKLRHNTTADAAVTIIVTNCGPVDAIAPSSPLVRMYHRK